MIPHGLLNESLSFLKFSFNLNSKKTVILNQADLDIIYNQLEKAKKEQLEKIANNTVYQFSLLKAKYEISDKACTSFNIIAIVIICLLYSLFAFLDLAKCFIEFKPSARNHKHDCLNMNVDAPMQGKDTSLKFSDNQKFAEYCSNNKNFDNIFHEFEINLQKSLMFKK